MVSQKEPSTSKEWRFPEEREIPQSLLAAAGESEILARLLMRRGLSGAEDVQAYLDPAFFQPSSPLELPGMSNAVNRVLQAIERKEKITIYGDYDVDGVTATAVMLTTLRKLGAEVDFYIPNRSEGYGLNLKAVSVLASKHRTKLIISCDCGISNFSEINFAKSLGVETIVTDHHTMPELLPPAVAILHPKQLPEDHPLFHLPGVGVAYKLCEALFIQQNQPSEVEKLLDFVTLGMIADMVPLVRECRYLVQIGLPHLVSSQRAGIKALLAQVSNKGEGTDLVGFGLAPRINAVGRLADAVFAVNLMITDDYEEAERLAKQLEVENLRRQELCEQIFKQADFKASQGVQSGDRAIAIFDADWHHGVVGIVASRLVEKYHCPVFIGELNEKEGIVKGSARGISGIDLYEVLKANEHLALKWGGHKMAAGWSVEAAKADLFCRAIVDTCNRLLGQEHLRPVVDIDLQLDPEQVNAELAHLVAKLAPFGMGNKRPVLAIRDIECSGSRPLGRENKHNRINLKSKEGAAFECVFWNSRGRVPDGGQTIDVAFSPEINHYNGTARLQLVLNDWRDPSQPYTAPIAVPASALAAVASAQPVLPEVAGSGLQASASVSITGASMDSPPDGKDSGRQSELMVRVSHRNVESAVTNEPSKRAITLKDVRSHAAPVSLVQAAVRKFGDTVAVYSENCLIPEGITVFDRTTIKPAQHLILWSYPPADSILKTLLEKTGATNVYLVGGEKPSGDDATTFLKRLLGLVRYAVNQRDGQADPDKIAAALGATKMSIALGLTILKKLDMVDWFAEDGIVNLDLLGQPNGKPEQLPEFKQLVNCLSNLVDFKRWCHETPLEEVQLHFAPAANKSKSDFHGSFSGSHTQALASGNPLV